VPDYEGFNEHLARLIHSGDWILGFIDGQEVWLSDPGDLEACKREMQAEMQSPVRRVTLR
jgi:hypothetical protein